MIIKNKTEKTIVTENNFEKNGHYIIGDITVIYKSKSYQVFDWFTR